MDRSPTASGVALLEGTDYPDRPKMNHERPHRSFPLVNATIHVGERASGTKRR